MARKKKEIAVESTITVEEKVEIKQFEIDWNKIAQDVREAKELYEKQLPTEPTESKPKSRKKKST